MISNSSGSGRIGYAFNAGSVASIALTTMGTGADTDANKQILTESGDTLVTEDGDKLIEE